MNYKEKLSKLFILQLQELSIEEKQKIRKRLDLALENPFRYKSLTLQGFTKVFEIKIGLQDNYSRIIYTIDGEYINIECIIKRKNDFKDLLKMLFQNRK